MLTFGETFGSLHTRRGYRENDRNWGSAKVSYKRFLKGGELPPSPPVREQDA